MKKIILSIIFASLSSVVLAQMDNSFTYQGELLDNGIPANDIYDFQIVMLNGAAQQIGITSQHNAIAVTNGLFTLNANFDIANFDGNEDYYFEISVRKTSIGGTYDTLSPLQQLQSVPLASNLTNGNASTGQVLTFNGSHWAPADNPASPWNESFGEVLYSGSMHLSGSANIVNNVTIGGVTRLNGVTHFSQNTAQPSSSQGQLKFMANFWCGNASTIVNRFYNGTFSPGNISVVAGATSGSCIITFPFNISERYWSVSADSGLARGANCSIGSSSWKLNCTRYKISDATDAGGLLNILVY